MDFLALFIIVSLTVGLVFRQLVKWRDSESISRTDGASGEENEACNSSGIEYKGSDTNDRMKRKRSSEAIPSTDTKPAYQYDVFLSFCGGDTRQTFTDNLYYRMKDTGISVFLDSEELEGGKQINEVLKAVDESQIYIPIFSRNFASRPWCLREVARMVERHSEPDGKREIIPIFYDVEPNDVKLRTDLYKNHILEHKRKGYFKSGEVEQWETALQKVGSMMGRELKEKRQGREIESIIKEVWPKLNGKHVDLPGYLVEDYRQIKAIIEKLDLNSGGVRFVGIHGVGGIGKTTLAKVVFKKLSSQFDRVSFLNDVRKSSELGLDGLVTLQKKLIRSVGGSLQADKIQGIEDGVPGIKEACRKKKVLIVLDDLNKKLQLAKLAGESKWFSPGSRIIITTRDESILTTRVESSSTGDRNQLEGILCYPVREMKLDRALQLFYKHAFGRNSPIEGYEDLSKNIVDKVDRLPLAIEVIGSYLYDLGSPHPHGVNQNIWKETLQKLDEGPFEDVRNVLMISYKGLDDKNKKVFLDIACFFTNIDRTYPVIMWEDCGYYPMTAIGILCQRSLIKIIDNKFWMHDQVRDLGRYIVLKEHTPKFSRVWKHEHAVELLKRKEKNEDVEALSLTSSGSSHNFVLEELAALPKLRFLQAKGANFSGNFKTLLPNLRWLSWQTWQTTFWAKNFHFSRLVVLNLSDSNIEDSWDGWRQMKMNKLKVLDLTGCRQLKRTPNLSNFESLEMLILARCVKLTAIDGSIGKLKLLKTFNINRCGALQELPKEFGSLQSLEKIIMPQNYKPFKLPETFGNLQSLSSFILDNHLGISKLPNSIGRLVKLTRLSLCECVGIKELPSSIGEMKMLVELDISKSGIVELPDSIGNLKKLKVIRVSYTKLRKFPRTIGQVEMLEELHAKKCWELTDENLKEIEKLSNLRILDISYTDLSRFPRVLGCLSGLETLEMRSSHPQEVPDLPSSLKHLHMQATHFSSIPNLSSLVSLHFLELSISTGSVEEPDITGTSDWPEEQVIHPLPSTLSTLILRSINLLPAFSNLQNLSELSIVDYQMSRFSVSQDLTHLRVLKLRKCEKLGEIPGLAFLKNLWHLDLNRLESLVKIDDLLELKSLEHFRIAHCNKIERLPNLSKLDQLRHIELEACPNIREIEGIKCTEVLKLDNRACTVLERLLDDPGSTWFIHRIPSYDVFVSFRGPDTGYSIVGFLYKNFHHNKILVYSDDEILTHGSEIGSQILIALDNSHIYIPVLSKKYACSRWCLCELARMVECKNTNGNRRILPIFYDVEKVDVKLESNVYRDALSNHRGKLCGDEVEEWEKALKYVGDLDGYSLKTNSLEEVIDLVTEEVSRELLNADVRRPQAAED